MDRSDQIKPQQLADRPGHQSQMKQKPKVVNEGQSVSRRLAGKRILITGGDSGIGQAVAVACAKAGADVAIGYLTEHEDAKKTIELVRQQGRGAYGWAGDVGDESFCKQLINNVIDKLGGLDVLINNAGEQHPQGKIEDISQAQLEKTFKSNIFSMFYMVKAARPHLKRGSAIINTSSVTAYKGNPSLLDYSATKGAITAFTRSLALNLASIGIRVNAVAPGPVWTPLIPSTFKADEVESFGKDTPLGRPGQPDELGPAYVFLASDESSYITGQTIHVNGGSVVNG